MGKYATGKFAQRISDRDGMAYPYSEMVQEWNGLGVQQPNKPTLLHSFVGKVTVTTT